MPSLNTKSKKRKLPGSESPPKRQATGGLPDAPEALPTPSKATSVVKPLVARPLAPKSRKNFKKFTKKAETAPGLALLLVPQEPGPLAFFAGSQRVEFGRDLGISDESERAITSNMHAHGFGVVDRPF